MTDPVTFSVSPSSVSPSSVSPSSVSPSSAAQAYGAVESGAEDPGTGFGATLSRALQNVAQSGQTADALATQAVEGHANLTEVVTAVSQAELALQTTTAIRDRVVSAYQDIMRMPI